MTPDIDEIAVERACKGDRSVPLTHAELAAAFHALNERGYSARVIAERLGVTDRTVQRWRSGGSTPKFAGHNRVRVFQDQDEPIPCGECGSVLTRRNMPRHVRKQHEVAEAS